MNHIEFKGLRRQYQEQKEKINEIVMRVMAQSQYIDGPEVAELEKRLSEYVGSKYCITCANGTDALQLVLIANNIGRGDAVFIPDFTFFATGEMIPMVGATPVFVDVDPKTFNIDPVSLQNAVEVVLEEGNLRPTAVIPVDLFGLPADYASIIEVAKRYNLILIEDAAQGFGSAINEKRACSFGDFAITSFFPAKPLGCYGDGGAIFTNDEECACLIKSLKTHGQGNHKYDNIRLGMNSRLDTLQAAVLLVKFKVFIEYELHAMSNIHAQYSETLQNYVEVPYVPHGFFSCNAQYTIKLPDRAKRDGLKAHLLSQGIPSMVYYPVPMHRQRAFHGLGIKPVNLANSTNLCSTVLSLPMHPYLEPDEIGRVLSAFESFV